MQDDWNPRFPTHNHSPLNFAPSVRRGIAAQRTRGLHASLIQACTASVIPTLPVPTYYLAVNPLRVTQLPKRANGLPNFPRIGLVDHL